MHIYCKLSTLCSLAEELVAAAQAQDAAQAAQTAAEAAQADASALARRLAAAEELLGEVCSVVLEALRYPHCPRKRPPGHELPAHYNFACRTATLVKPTLVIAADSSPYLHRSERRRWQSWQRTWRMSNQHTGSRSSSWSASLRPPEQRALQPQPQW